MKRDHLLGYPSLPQEGDLTSFRRIPAPLGVPSNRPDDFFGPWEKQVQKWREKKARFEHFETSREFDKALAKREKALSAPEPAPEPPTSEELAAGSGPWIPWDLEKAQVAPMANVECCRAHPIEVEFTNPSQERFRFEVRIHPLNAHYWILEPGENPHSPQINKVKAYRHLPSPK